MITKFYWRYSVSPKSKRRLMRSIDELHGLLKEERLLLFVSSIVACAIILRETKEFLDIFPRSGRTPRVHWNPDHKADTDLLERHKRRLTSFVSKLDVLLDHPSWRPIVSIRNFWKSPLIQNDHPALIGILNTKLTLACSCIIRTEEHSSSRGLIAIWQPSRRLTPTEGLKFLPSW